MLSESQSRINLQGITKLKGKLTKLKDSLSLKTEQCTQYENEVFRLSQLIEAKDNEVTTIFSQYNELRNKYDTEIKEKENMFLSKIKSKLK